MNFERYALYGLKIFVSFIQISGDYYRLTCFHLIVSSKSNTTEQSLFVSRPIRRCVYDTTERTPFHVLSWPCNPHYIFLFSTQSGLGPDFCQGWWRNTFASTCHGWIFTGIRRREKDVVGITRPRKNVKRSTFRRIINTPPDRS